MRFASAKAITNAGSAAVAGRRNAAAKATPNTSPAAGMITPPTAASIGWTTLSTAPDKESASAAAVATAIRSGWRSYGSRHASFNNPAIPTKQLGTSAYAK